MFCFVFLLTCLASCCFVLFVNRREHSKPKTSQLLNPRVLRALGPAVLAPGSPRWSRQDTALGWVHFLPRITAQKHPQKGYGRGSWPKELNKHVTFSAIKSN